MNIMIVTMIKTLFLMFWNILKMPIYVSLVGIAIFYVNVFIFIFYYKKKGYNFIKGVYNTPKKRSAILKLLIDLPKQFAYDMINRDPEFFKYQGLIIYEGRQGSGKTSTLVHDAMQMQLEYPKCLTISNLGYTRENGKLEHWKQLVNFKNGKHGIIVMMDELQNWFNSNQSRNFPPEMLGVITQNRKNRRIILGTTQSFHLLSKSIRSQCTQVRKCTTLLGCLTFVRKVEPILDSEGNVAEWKKRGWYFYVHNQELRNAYDTYAVINSLSDSGFKEEVINIEINS